ncbi:hypothetical protein P4S91_26400, partial [Aneurinibacillus aneurinilyticus]|nr:hypothetical protein [Aneurinibacillus aneurinilyticus]
HKVEERRCTRRRVPSSFSHKEETRPLCGARAGPAKHLGLSVRETNRRRLSHGVVTTHSGSFWIINTLEITLDILTGECGWKEEIQKVALFISIIHTFIQ